MTLIHLLNTYMKKVWPLMSFISLLLNRNKKIIIDPEKIMRYVRNECTFTDAMKVTHCFQRISIMTIITILYFI